MIDFPTRHSCGHLGAVAVVNPQCLCNSEKLEIRKAEKRLCPTCYSANCEVTTEKEFGKLPGFLGSPRQAEFAQDVLRRLLAGLPSDGTVSALLSQETLEARPLLDAWQSNEHRDLNTPAGFR